jgi:hypothetical protein
MLHTSFLRQMARILFGPRAYRYCVESHDQTEIERDVRGANRLELEMTCVE